jgi:hypothetical protein
MPRARVTSLIGRFLCILLLSSTVATAQTPKPQPGPLQLGPHSFTPNGTLGEPFIRTHFRTSLGIGQALDLYIPVLEIDSSTVIGLHGDLVFAILDFEYQYAMKDWLAVWIRPSILARVGTEVQSFLAQGMSAVAGFELGTMFKFYQSERVALSGTVKLRNSNATLLSVLDFVNGIVDSGYVVAPLVRSTQLLSGGGGVRVAWSVNDLLGVLGSLDIGLGEAADIEQTTLVFYDLTAAIDLDLSARTAAPLGISLAYDQSSWPVELEISDQASRAVRLTVGYTGHREYFIGLDISQQWLPSLFSDDPIRSGAVLITTRYFF